MQDALGLKKMTTFMADSDLESGTDGESNSRDKRIPKANAVDVLARARTIISRQEPNPREIAGRARNALRLRSSKVDLLLDIVFSVSDRRPPATGAWLIFMTLVVATFSVL